MRNKMIAPRMHSYSFLLVLFCSIMLFTWCASSDVPDPYDGWNGACYEDNTKEELVRGVVSSAVSVAHATSVKYRVAPSQQTDGLYNGLPGVERILQRVDHPETCLDTSPIWPRMAFDKWIGSATDWADTDSICVYFNIVSNLTYVAGPDPVSNAQDAWQWHNIVNPNAEPTTWEVVIVNNLDDEYESDYARTFNSFEVGIPPVIFYTKLTIVESVEPNRTIAHEYGHTWDSTQSHQDHERYKWPETNMIHYGEGQGATGYPQRNYQWNLMTYNETGGSDADMEFKINKFPYNDIPWPCYRWCENF